MANNINEEFIKQMRHELKENSDKGNWDEWCPVKQECISELMHHSTKLFNALIDENSYDITEYSADLANIAMKISNTHGEV